MSDATSAGPPGWYAEWAAWHRGLFLLPAEWEDAALGWWRLFASLGAGPGELAAATHEVQRGDVPEYPRQHLPAVRGAVGRLRNKAADDARRKAAGGDQRSTCVHCGDSGWVTVPHADDVAGGEWRPRDYHPTLGFPRWRHQGVACRCYVGRKTHAERAEAGRPCRTLEDYERDVLPLWAAAMAARDRQAAELDRAERAAPDPVGRALAGVGRPVPNQ